MAFCTVVQCTHMLYSVEPKRTYSYLFVIC